MSDAVETTTPSAGGPLSATDLAELMAGFNDVSAKLEATHNALRDEVKRLSAELREANEALQRSKRLAALGGMAAGIAHEVRNPLGSIRLYAKMLEDDLADAPEQRGIATKIGSAVVRLNEVVGDVLTFARELRVRTERLDAEDTLLRAVGSCREPGGQEPEVLAEPGLVLWADAGLSEQALVNVIRNAVEAGGPVRVSASRADDPETGQAATVVRVRDAGPGIPAEAIERVFNPFFTTRQTGTGLGLPIVHRIIDAHAGRVVLTNNNEHEPDATGVTVELWFPEPVADAEVRVRSRSGRPMMERVA